MNKTDARIAAAISASVEEALPEGATVETTITRDTYDIAVTFMEGETVRFQYDAWGFSPVEAMLRMGALLEKLTD